jgi:large subunit ribosomal protein L19
MANSGNILNQDVHVGDTVRVSQRVQEEGKERTQLFEGILIAIKGSGSGKSFRVRKLSSGGIGVEKIWPVISPNLTKLVVVKRGSVARGKLYYLRDRIGKLATRIKQSDTDKNQSEQKAAGKTG